MNLNITIHNIDHITNNLEFIVDSCYVDNIFGMLIIPFLM